ncbi:MAG TPA: phosphatidate cytidylyltransferase [Syntrophales bacterium]|nr:phosphatidate cytidylyltransferase [Syntrophales bacterium]HOX95194.1 phosphatidate cytidylyltransferase [Syntrophales bacterium]HPI55876.1 phosphatidate cytidylyltransferase [Syntrophales bacterium]HPN23633.1 phosphatidate cytidylyltransferase [Syntrophales bacterium]HQM27842.1 phosphatidate cytidylyltransferase [Syntrophales bacterium]
MISSHFKRWITAVIAVPILFVLVLYASDLVFALFVTAVSLVGMLEYNRLVFDTPSMPERLLTILFALLLPLAAHFGNSHVVLGVIAVGVLVSLVGYVLTKARVGNFDLSSPARLLLGVLYIPFLLSHIILLRQGEKGINWVFFIIVIAFAGDVAAFYIGRTFGKRKLAPRVSPGKTVEGIYGLVAGSVLGCVVYQHFVFPQLPVAHAVVMGFMGSLIGQTGDLFESTIKRASGVKDSGEILPGHGGILDRIDCLLFIIPFVYYYKVFVIA